MDCQVVLDRKGNVIAAIYKSTSAPEIYDSKTPRVGPVVEDGQTVVEIGISEEQAKLPLEEFVGHLQIEAQAKLAKMNIKEK